MDHTCRKTAVYFCWLLSLAACSDGGSGQVSSNDGAEENLTGSAAPAETSAQPVAYDEFNTRATIRDVMNTLIDPHADAIWESVRVEVDADGIREYYPETDEEWEALRKSAIAIIEGANSLMIPGRRVAPPGATTEYPDYEFLPEEVEEKLKEDRLSWIAFAQGLQNTTLSVLEAIENRDVDLLTERGGIIDQACEACHSQYWYKEGF